MLCSPSPLSAHDCVFLLSYSAPQISHGMDVLHSNIDPDVASRQWDSTPGKLTSHPNTESQCASRILTSIWPPTEFLYNWETPQAAQPAGDYHSRLFHFQGNYRLDADYSLNYFQWNKPGGIGAPHEVVGNQPNPFMHMFETRTGLFQV
jgi:hypothetical protein